MNFLIRLICRIGALLIYGLRIRGTDYFPRRSGALLVCNHVTYLDGLLLLGSVPRPIRFLIDADFVNSRFVGIVLRALGAIPMPRGGGPKAVREALDAVTARLQAGEVVVLFPEGAPTRSGALLPFQRGMERVARRANVPIVPACIEHMWGSIFSYFEGPPLRKWFHRPYGPVTVAFGQPMPANSTAFEVRSAVQELLSYAAKKRTRECMPLHRQFLRRAARQPFRRCLVDASGEKLRVLNYAETVTGAVCLRDWLRPQVNDAAMIGVWLPSSLGGVLANVALTFMGRTSVNLNYTAGPESIRSAVQQCKITTVVTAKRFLKRMPFPEGIDVKLIELEDAAPQITKWKRITTYAMAVAFPAWLLEAIIGVAGHRGDKLATVIFSSGSTGEPKGIMLSHKNIAANVEAFLEQARFSVDDRVLGVLPFFHSFGYTVTLWGPLVVGASSLYHPDPRAAKEVGDLCREHKCTLMASTATFLRFYLRKCGADDFRTMRLMVCGAEKLPVSLALEFAEKFGIRPFEGYGCTELSPVVSVNMPDVEINTIKQICNKDGTIGHPLPGVAVKCVDPDSHAPRPPDTEGLLLVTGPNVMEGYLHRPDLTRKAIRDGWYITGDMGKIDEDGFITITGRQSRFAKIGGEMIPLERLEEEMHAILNTNDRLLAVAAVPDEKRGERIVVMHLPMEMTPKQINTGLSERGITNLWIPGDRDYFPVEAIPLLGTGKLDLQGVKQLAFQVTGLAK